MPSPRLAFALSSLLLIGAAACGSGDGDDDPGAVALRRSYEPTVAFTIPDLWGFVHAQTHLDGDRAFIVTGSKIVEVDRVSGKSRVAFETHDFLMEHMALDADHFYVATDRSIISIPRAGGASTVLVSQEQNFRDLELRDGQLYFVNDTRIARVAVTGGPVQTLAPVSGPSEVRFSVNRLLVEDGVYAASSPQRAEALGKVVRIPLAGGAPTVVQQGDFVPYDLASDAHAVYWTRTDGPLRMGDFPASRLFQLDRGASAPVELAEISTRGSFVVNEVGFYWCDYERDVIRAVSRDGQSGDIDLIDADGSPVQISADERGLAWTTTATSTGEQTVHFLPRRAR